jgi:hypothetical protein
MKLGFGFFSFPGIAGAAGARFDGSAAAPDGVKTISGSIGSGAAFSRRENLGGKTPS